MKKNGFVSTSVIYSFFILFILLMTLLLSSYSSVRILLEEYKADIKNTFADDYISDVNLYIYVDDGNGYYEVTSVPTGAYNYNSSESKCYKGSSISYNGTSLVLTMNNKDTCEAYFDKVESDIIVYMYVYDSNVGDYVKTSTMPDAAYKYQDGVSYCENDSTIEFYEDSRTYSITASNKDTCYLYFALEESDLILHIYQESSDGEVTYNNKNYIQIYDGTPNTNKYKISDWTCNNNVEGSKYNTEVGIEDGQFYVEAYHKDECSVYFDKLEPRIDVDYYMESTTGSITGDEGYTTGVSYTSVTDYPNASRYKYVGTRCWDYYDESTEFYDFTATCSDGTCVVNSEESVKCKAYFDKIPAVISVVYMIEDTDGTYYQVNKVPSVGYVYNSSKSSCINGGTISVDGNVATATNDVDDTCTVYFDLTTKDITVLVYVYNYSEGKYVLSASIPTSNYAYKSYSCTNGATLEYSNGRIIVATENATICEVYFGGS